MNASEYRYNWRGEDFRILVAGDVVSLPGSAGRAGWSMGGFGASISEEWLMHEGALPGPIVRRRALASMIVRALASHAGRSPGASGDADRVPRGPFTRCPTCNGEGSGRMSGWIPAPAGSPGAIVIQEG